VEHTICLKEEEGAAEDRVQAARGTGPLNIRCASLITWSQVAYLEIAKLFEELKSNLAACVLTKISRVMLPTQYYYN